MTPKPLALRSWLAWSARPVAAVAALAQAAEGDAMDQPTDPLARQLALSALTTEQFNLQTARMGTIAEANGPSSGQTVRVRLNRSGDRQLDQTLRLVVLTRLRYDPATRAYAQRRRAQARPIARSNTAWSATLPVSCFDCWSAKQAAGSWFDHPISNRDHAQTAGKPTPSRRSI